MKHFFIKDFKDANDQIPLDSWPVCSDVVSLEEQKKAVENSVEGILSHFRRCPKGKVDFVWI